MQALDGKGRGWALGGGAISRYWVSSRAALLQRQCHELRCLLRCVGRALRDCVTLANTAGQSHALIDCYGQHRRCVGGRAHSYLGLFVATGIDSVDALRRHVLLAVAPPPPRAATKNAGPEPTAAPAATVGAAAAAARLVAMGVRLRR